MLIIHLYITFRAKAALKGDGEGPIGVKGRNIDKGQLQTFSPELIRTV